MAPSYKKQNLYLGEGEDTDGPWIKRRWRAWLWWQRLLVILISLMVLGMVVALVLLIIVLARAGAASTPQSNLDILNNAVTPGVEDGKELERAQRLAGALRIPTISYDFNNQNFDAILELHTYIKQSFPLVHSSSFINLEIVNSYSLLYTIRGSDNRGKLPYLLTSHLDVVPADPNTWEVHPFEAGVVNSTFIYGRGAFDDKGGVMGILEGLEYMLSRGERPMRDFFIGYGHDEEISGQNGAKVIAERLKTRGFPKLDFVYDEGLFITDETIPGTDFPTALIGVTEKGYLTLELTVQGRASHSSFPPWESAIGILSKAVTKLEENKLPSMFGSGPEKFMFEYLAPKVDFGTRMLYCNFWLLSGLMTAQMEGNPLLNTVIRTTTALTVFNGGIKDNVVPGSATAIVNHRIHPSQTVAEVIKFDTEVINDPRVQIKVRNSMEAHPISPFGPGDVHYQMLAKSVLQTFEGVVVAPGVLTANTDTKWYLEFTKNIFRFFPTILNQQDALRFHGNNERIGVEMYANSVSFYHRVMKNADLIIDYATSTS